MTFCLSHHLGDDADLLLGAVAFMLAILFFSFGCLYQDWRWKRAALRHGAVQYHPELGHLVWISGNEAITGRLAP